MSDPDVTAALAHALLDFAVGQGADRAALLARSGIGAEVRGRQDLPAERYVALVRAAKEMVGTPALALHFGEYLDIGDVAVVGLLSQSCKAGMPPRSCAVTECCGWLMPRAASGFRRWSKPRSRSARAGSLQDRYRRGRCGRPYHLRSRERDDPVRRGRGRRIGRGGVRFRSAQSGACRQRLHRDVRRETVRGGFPGPFQPLQLGERHLLYRPHTDPYVK